MRILDQVYALHLSLTNEKTESIPEVLKSHALSNLGPECENCSKPLRSGRARFCPACGHRRDPPPRPPAEAAEPPRLLSLTTSSSEDLLELKLKQPEQCDTCESPRDRVTEQVLTLASGPPNWSQTLTCAGNCPSQTRTGTGHLPQDLREGVGPHFATWYLHLEPTPDLDSTIERLPLDARAAFSALFRDRDDDDPLVAVGSQVEITWLARELRAIGDPARILDSIDLRVMKFLQARGHKVPSELGEGSLILGASTLA